MRYWRDARFVARNGRTPDARASTEADPIAKKPTAGVEKSAVRRTRVGAFADWFGFETPIVTVLRVRPLRFVLLRTPVW